MQNLSKAVLASLLTLSLCASAETLQLAQAPSQGQGQAQVQPQPRNQARTQTGAQKQAVAQKPAPQTPSCNMDGRPVPDGTSWCRKSSTHVCKAATGQWINMGKKCP